MERLIYTDSELNDVGYLSGFELDIENGRDDDFELKMPINRSHILSAGCFIYCENHPEYGGRVEKLIPNTANKTIIFAGSTWRGVFKKKILTHNIVCTTSSTLSGIVQNILDASAFNTVFSPLENLSKLGTDIETGLLLTPLQTLETILSTVNCRPSFVFNPIIKKVQIGTNAVADYSKAEYDSDRVAMELTVNKMPVNHIIAADKNNNLHHLFLLHDGSYSKSPEITGAAEITRLIAVNSDISEEITAALIAAMDEEQANAQSAALSINNISAEIGDIVGSFDNVSKTLVTAKITSKVLKMTDKTFLINFETGE